MLILNKGQIGQAIQDISISINTFSPVSSTVTSTSRTVMALLTGVPLLYTEWDALSPQQRIDMCTIGDVASSRTLIASMSRYGDAAITSVGSTLSQEPSLDIDFRQFDRSLAPVSGSPSWFILHSTLLSVSGSPSPSLTGTFTYLDSGTQASPRGFTIIGTVGAVWSGADMELLHPTFTVGQETALDTQQIVFNRGFV